ncbi:MAG: hypothetical protein R3F40_06840 [Candidatus Competibacteraceae bacterium]
MAATLVAFFAIFHGRRWSGTARRLALLYSLGFVVRLAHLVGILLGRSAPLGGGTPGVASRRWRRRAGRDCSSFGGRPR